MQHKCKVTVIDKKCFTDFQENFLADPHSGACPFYHIGDEFIFERYDNEDTFWHMDNGQQCSEAWDCISRYIYTALQGGSIMRGWTNDERMMIACCNDGTRPVIFKIERIDYKVVKLAETISDLDALKINIALRSLPGVENISVVPDKKWIEVFVAKEQTINDNILKSTLKQCGNYTVIKID